ncbi:MAG: hypothetical protein PHG96_13995, partial [Kiritimatiellae bacterium]|nr:hypothetical protein [Kiritimatiellia bacterium]
AVRSSSFGAQPPMTRPSNKTNGNKSISFIHFIIHKNSRGRYNSLRREMRRRARNPMSPVANQHARGDWVLDLGRRKQ